MALSVSQFKLKSKVKAKSSPRTVSRSLGYSLDSQNLRGTILGFGGQFREGLAAAARVRPPFKPDRVVLAGMGGSSLFVELVNHWLTELPTPVYAQRSYGLPEWAGPRTLVIATSYSGNTEETLDSFDEAQKRGCALIAVANGGELETRAKAGRVPFVRVPAAPQPRYALGYFVGVLSQLLANAGLAKDRSSELLAVADFLDREVPRMESAAAKLAKSLKGRIPLIYAPSRHYWTARVCKIKFNENAKVPAFFNALPELNHNEMTGMTRPLAKFAVVFLDDEAVDARIVHRLNVTQGLYAAKGIPTHWVKLQGKSWLERSLYAIAFCDWTSVHLAFEYGIDPAPVHMQEEFKRQIAGG